MKELVNCVDVRYYESSTIEHQGNRESIRSYLNQGYYVQLDRNGYWVLNRPTKVIATLQSQTGTVYYCDIKQHITSYFYKNRISYKQYEDFCKVISDGRIRFYIDEYGNCTIEQ